MNILFYDLYNQYNLILYNLFFFLKILFIYF